MTVGELIEKLKEFPEDMIVGIVYELHRDQNTHKFYEVEAKIAPHWKDTDYPYDEEGYEHISLE